MIAPRTQRHREHAGIASAGPNFVVKIQHHDGREGQHRADRQIEIAADDHEGHAERHDPQDRRGPDHAEDVVRVDEPRVPRVNPIMKT
jgi:hypothetical protein